MLALLFAQVAYSQSGEPDISAQEQLRRASLSIVSITGKDSKGRDTEPGRGFFAASNVVATDYQVIKDAIKIFVTSEDKKKKEAQLIGVDTSQMLAILKLEESKIDPLTINTSERLAAGSRVYCPDSSGWSERQVINNTSIGDRQMIEIGANISKDFRGCPLLNELGEVVAIIVSNQDVTKKSALAASVSHLVPLGEISVEGGFLGERAMTKANSTSRKTESEPFARYTTYMGESDNAGIKIVRKPSNMIYSSAIRRVVPLYPPKAKKSRIVGLATVEMLIGEDGNVLWVRGVSGHEFFKEAAIAAARGWKFQPSTVKGRPVRVIGLLTFNFTS
jgi:TonB family protein